MAFRLPSLLPQENKFSVLLTDMAKQASVCARELEIFVKTNDPAESARAAAAITASRELNKVHAAEMTQALCQTFVTPFDREDIQEFSSLLYRVTKIIEKVKDRMEMHGLDLKQGDFIPQVELIVETSEATLNLVDDLLAKRTGKQIKERVTTLYDVENKGDIVLAELLVKLFNSDAKVRELILHKDIYDMLEKVIDRYRDAGGVALQMALKYL